VLDVIHKPRLNHRLPVTSGLLAEECGGILRAFFGRKRRKEAEGRNPPDPTAE